MYVDTPEHLDANAAKTAERLVYDEAKRKAAADGTSLDNSNKRQIGGVEADYVFEPDPTVGEFSNEENFQLKMKEYLGILPDPKITAAKFMKTEGSVSQLQRDMATVPWPRGKGGNFLSPTMYNAKTRLKETSQPDGPANQRKWAKEAAEAEEDRSVYERERTCVRTN